jgi:hypothetical protein
VRIATEPFRTTVARDDGAAVLATIVHAPRAAERVLYAGVSDDPIEEALARGARVAPRRGRTAGRPRHRAVVAAHSAW